MRATVFHGPFDVRVEQVRDAALQEPSHTLDHPCRCLSICLQYLILL